MPPNSPALPGSHVIQSRPLSGMERLWLVADRIAPPFANQMVLEGEGLPDPSAAGGWEQVLTALAEAQPGCRVRLRGWLGGCHWLADGPLPELRELDASGWDGCSPAGAPFLQQRLDPWRGPVCQILLLAGSPSRVVLRTHHAATDGRGTLLFAEALFAVLRGERPAQASAGPLTDEGLAVLHGARPATRLPEDSRSPTGAAESKGPLEMTWVRRRVAPCPSPLLPRVTLALARSAAASDHVPQPSTFRVGIPVDLRRHAAGLQSSANLTGIVHLELHALMQEPDPLAACSRELQRLLGERAELGAVLAARFTRGLPLALLAWTGQAAAHRTLRRGLFGASAAISNLGRLELDRLSGGGFRAERCFFVPPGNPGLPLFLTCTGDPAGVELCAAAPRVLADGGRLDGLLDGLSRELEAGTA